MGREGICGLEAHLDEVGTLVSDFSDPLVDGVHRHLSSPGTKEVLDFAFKRRIREPEVDFGRVVEDSWHAGVELEEERPLAKVEMR